MNPLLLLTEQEQYRYITDISFLVRSIASIYQFLLIDQTFDGVIPTFTLFYKNASTTLILTQLLASILNIVPFLIPCRKRNTKKNYANHCTNRIFVATTNEKVSILSVTEPVPYRWIRLSSNLMFIVTFSISANRESLNIIISTLQLFWKECFTTLIWKWKSTSA